MNLAVAMGFGVGEDEDQHPLMEGLNALLEAVGLADLSPEEMGFSAEDIPAYVAAAMKLTGTRQFLNMPVPMTEADVQEVFEGVFER